MNMQFLLFFVVVCKCIVYQQIMTCCESHTTLFLYQVWCMSVLLVAFLSYTNMHIPIVLAVVHSKDYFNLQTNYGDVVMLYQFSCV